MGGEADLFESPRALLQWAYEDTERFKAVEKAYFESQPYETVVEFDEKYQRDAHRIRLTCRPPDELRKLASHVVSDLRHALDQATFVAASRFGWKPSRQQKVLYFPWATSVADLTGQLNRIPAQLHEVMLEVEPYPFDAETDRGNDIVRELGRIAGGNKHQAALAGVLFGNLSHMKLEWNADWRVPYAENMWDHKKRELTLGYFPVGTSGAYDAEISVRLTFLDRPILRPHAVSDLLAYWGPYVQHVVEKLEGVVSPAAID